MSYVVYDLIPLDLSLFGTDGGAVDEESMITLNLVVCLRVIRRSGQVFDAVCFVKPFREVTAEVTPPVR